MEWNDTSILGILGNLEHFRHFLNLAKHEALALDKPNLI
jgi:hypothetical protein